MSSSAVVKYPKDTVLFLQGEMGESAFIVEKGRVLIYLSKDKEDFPLTVLGEGEIFGEMAILDNQVRSASAKALDDCELIPVTKEMLLERVHATDTVVRLLLRVLLKRLRSQNDLVTREPKKEFFSTQIVQQEDIEAVQKIKLESRLKDAFNNREFVMYYQPILDLKQDKIIGAEALIRWFPPTGEQISPAIFMDVIESSALMIPFGRWILEQCFKDLRVIQEKKNDKKFSLSINISGKQFIHSDFIDEVENLRTLNSLEAQSIKLEMTERVMMDGTLALDTLSRFHDIGYGLSIDDFGTGFSSLQYLFRMPLDNIKIDRSFVRDMLKDDKALAIVKSLIYLAQSLRMKVIAEGIEREEEKSLLKALGVEQGQGFLFSKAISLQNFLTLVSNKK
ncbi:MAG: EAL domain-containing protein [Bdellovibrionaceae bacterium]|nr:EAL domain-containing protein [Pseudobdellovibrionaceae bacterium]